MTKPPIAVITSVERRRPWAHENREQLVAAWLKPETVPSEIARAAGVHVGQLFRGRKELCQIREPRRETMSTLPPVIVFEGRAGTLAGRLRSARPLAAPPQA